LNEPAVVVKKAYDWALWIIPKVEKFPKSYRFSIGQSLVTSSLELLMNLVDATYQSRNAGSLGAAVKEVNRIRYLARLAKDLRVLNIDGHEFAAKSMDEVGRMAGGSAHRKRIRDTYSLPKPALKHARTEAQSDSESRPIRRTSRCSNVTGNSLK
jgi:hypothetical protein